MKFWKRGLEYGTMDDTGTVPGASECSKAEYDAYVASKPPPAVVIDHKALFAAASTTAEKIQVIAGILKLI